MFTSNIATVLVLRRFLHNVITTGLNVDH